jgi:hypothetical protein
VFKEIIIASEIAIAVLETVTGVTPLAVKVPQRPFAPCFKMIPLVAVPKVKAPDIPIVVTDAKAPEASVTVPHLAVPDVPAELISN